MVKAFSSGGAAGGEDYLVVDAAGSAGIELDPDFLFSADFIKQGDDLLLRGADGKEVLIRDYFVQDPPPPLQTAEGARLLADTVESLAAPEMPLGYAQAGNLQLGEPIGQVSLLNGVARVQRPDGTRADLNEGDPIFQGDVVSTGVGSELGIIFIDETVFSLSANARMIIDELIYNPGSTTNSMGVSLLQGTFVFVTGQVAPNGGMEVETPVGVIGIRGTTVGVQIATIGGRTSIANLTNSDTGETGSFTFSNDAGQALFSLANHFLEVRSASADPGVPTVTSGQDIVTSFGRALNTALQVQRTISQQQNDDDDPTEPDPAEEQESQLEGEPLQSIEEAQLTPEQIQALLSQAPIETASGPQGTGGDQPQGGGSSFAAGLQPPAESNPIEFFNSNVDAEIAGVGVGTGESTPTPEPAAEPGQPQNSPPAAPPPASNAAPVITGIASGIQEGGLAVLGPANLSATDAETVDPALLTYTVTGVVNGLVLLTTTGGGLVVTFSFTQADVDAGRLRFAHDGSETTTAGFVVQASDPNGGVSAPKVVALAITPVNDPPEAADDAFATDENALLAGNVFADNGSGADSDVDGGPLSITAVNGNSGGVGSQITLNSGALLTVNADGSFDYDPNGEFDSLLPGETDTDSFTYTVSDGNGGSDVASVTITINGLNLPPDAVDDDLSTDEDSSLTGSLLADNGNGVDSDPDGGLLSIIAVNGSGGAVGSQITLASGALLTVNSDGTFDYDPNGAFEDLQNGGSDSDSFTYTLSDGTGGSDSATVTIDIGGVNDAPEVTTAPGLLVKGTSILVDASLLSASDADHPNAADITFTVSGETAGAVLLSGSPAGSFTLADVNAGLVTFEHDDSAGASAGFSVVASDPLGGSSPLTPVSFTVAAGFVWTNGGGDGDWDNPANWATNTVPVSGADVTIATAGPATFSAGSLALNTLTLAAEDLNVTGGSLSTLELYGDSDSLLSLSGGTLEIGTIGEIAGFFDWSGGTLDGVAAELSVTGIAALTGGPLTLDTALLLEGASELAADISGSGNVSNSGSLTVNGPSNVQTAFTNTVDGDIEIDGAGNGGSVTLEFSGLFNQLGDIALTSTAAGGATGLVVSGGPLTNQGSLTTEVGLGGTRSIEAELINEGSATFDAATVITGAGAEHANENGGTLSVNADVTVNGATSFRNSGQMTVATGTVFLLALGDFENAIDGVINGNGDITVASGSFTNNGTINPGSSPGTLTVNGDFTQGADGVLNIEIGASDSDILVVGGVADFAGSIVITFLDGHVPTAGDTLNFIVAEDIIDSGVEITGANYAGGLLGIQLAGGTASFVAINASGDAFVDPYEIIVGETAVGSLSIDAGQSIASQYLSVGEEASGNGQFTLTNASSLTIEGASFIGNAGTGAATISGGADAIFDSDNFDNLVVGAQAGSLGTLTIEGAGTTVTTTGIDNTIQVGLGGSGSMTVQNGAQVSTLQLEAGRNGDGDIVIQGSGTQVTASNDDGLFSGEDEGYAGFVRAGRNAGSDGSISVLDGALLEIRSGQGVNTETTGPGLQIAREFGSQGSVLVDGAGSAITLSQTVDDGARPGPGIAVGRGGSGELTIQNGGTVSTGGGSPNMVVGRFGGADGTLTVDGSGSALTLNGDDAFVGVGVEGSGAVTVSGGGAVEILGADSHIVFGDNGDSSGALLVTGGSQFTVSDGGTRIGNHGSGEATIDGGATADFDSDSFDNLSIGHGAGSIGSLLIDGSGTVVTTSGQDSTVQVGRFGDGTLTVQNGAELHTLQLEAGREGLGQIDIQGAGTLVTASNDVGLFSGDDAPYAGFVRAGRVRDSDGEINVLDGATLEIRNGQGINEATTDPGLQIARQSGSLGRVTVDGASSSIEITQTAAANPGLDLFGPFLQVGRLGDGNLTVSNGGAVSLSGDNSGFAVAGRFGSRGDLDVLSGGTINIDSGFSVDHGGDGLGHLGLAGEVYSRADVEIDGIGSSVVLQGEETHAQLGGDGLASINITGGGVFSNFGEVATTSIGGFGAYRVDVTVDGVGSQLNAGGTLNIGDASPDARASLTITNGATVSAGTVFLQESGALAGDGTLVGNVTVDGGVIEPGTSPGTLEIDGDLLINDGLLTIEVNGDVPDSEHDVLDVSGAAAVNGGVIEFVFDAGWDLFLLNPITFLTTGTGLSENGQASIRLVGVESWSLVDYDINIGPNDLTLDITTLYGGSGVYFDGGDRNDVERGGESDDYLLGGLGDDTLGGSSGSDTLAGGDGFDRFLATDDALDPLGYNEDTITIEDFNPSQDVLEIIGAPLGGLGGLDVDEIGNDTFIYLRTKTIVLTDVTLAQLNGTNVVFRVIAHDTVSTSPDGQLFVGNDGDGIVSMSGGAVFESGAAVISAHQFANGDVNVSGAGTVWRITTDDVNDSVVLGNDTNGGGGAFGYGGTLDISDGALVRIAGDEDTAFESTGMIIGRGGDGSVEVTSGGRLEILDPALIGSDVFLGIGGSGGQANGVGDLTVEDAGSTLLMQSETAVVALGRNGISADASMVIANGGVFEMNGVSGAFFNIGRDGADGDLLVDGGSLLINSALDPALQLGRHGDSQATATVQNSGLIEISGSEAFLAVGRTGNGESPLSSLNVLSGGQVQLDGVADNANAVIGRDAGSNGMITVSDKGSELTLEGRETHISVGNEGLGVLNVEQGGFVSALGLSVGSQAGGFGSVIVDGISLDETQRSELRLTGSYNDGDGAFLQVGRDGQGSMVVQNGALLSIDGQGGTYPGFALGRNAGSVGSLSVVGEGSEVTITNGSAATGGGEGFIAIGREGDGSLFVLDGASVTNAAGGYTFIGRELGAQGSLLVGGVEAPGALFDAGEVLIIGADFDFDSGTIDFANGGTGTATVGADATLRAGVAEADGITDIFIGAGGTLTIQVGGTVIGDIENVGGTLINGSSPGTASFGGDFAMDDGFLEVELGGDEAGDFDLYQVAGAASLGGGVIGFSLIDGYDPEAGDSIEFLTAGNGLSVDEEELSFVFTGVGQGFDFAVDFTAEGARVTILNDAGAGDSLIYLGGAGRDDVLGGAGDDYLDGGAGSDTLTGGAGEDRFVLREGDAAESLELADLVTDFSVGEDLLALADGLSAADLALTTTGSGDAAVSLQSSGAYLVVLQGVSAADTSLEELTASL